MVKLSSIHINPDNPRIIKDEQFKKLIKSIEEFPKMMELRSIVVDDKGMILGGEKRYLALKELKYKEVSDNWIKKASELTDEEKKRFIISDNVHAGEWDEILLKDWDSSQLSEWGLEINEKPIIEKKELNISAFKKTHILISFSPDKLIEIDTILEQLKNKPFIEYLQGSN